MSAVYAIAIILCPVEYKKAVLSVVILSDPAILGMFFIGGIWLLEKGEGLQRFWSVSPLLPMEYILSKSLSLAILSTLSATMIVLVGLGGRANYFLLSIGVFVGSMIFTVIGLAIASYSRSVNHYMLLVTPPATLLFLPPMLTAFHVTHPLFEMFPSTALWRIISYSVRHTEQASAGLWLVLLLWLALALFATNQRITKAMRTGGEIL